MDFSVHVSGFQQHLRVFVVQFQGCPSGVDGRSQVLLYVFVDDGAEMVVANDMETVLAVWGGAERYAFAIEQGRGLRKNRCVYVVALVPDGEPEPATHFFWDLVGPAC